MQWLPTSKPLAKLALRPYSATTPTGTVTVHKKRWKVLKRTLQFGLLGGIGYSAYGKCGPCVEQLDQTYSDCEIIGDPQFCGTRETLRFKFHSIQKRRQSLSLVAVGRPLLC